MRDALSKVLGHEEQEMDAGVDRILQAAFFRKRPLQAGSSAHVIHLADRRSARMAGASSRDMAMTTDGFLVRGGRR